MTGIDAIVDSVWPRKGYSVVKTFPENGYEVRYNCRAVYVHVNDEVLHREHLNRVRRAVHDSIERNHIYEESVFRVDSN